MHYNELKLDCLPPGSRRVWLHKDECKFYRDEFQRAYSAPIINISVRDCIDFAINLYNLAGSVDINSIKFLKPNLESTTKILNNVQLSPYKNQYVR